MNHPVDKVKAFLARFPYGFAVHEFDASTHTAELAARAVGVEVGQIAKSLLFLINDLVVLVVTSGDVKVGQSRLKQHLGVAGKVRLPDPATTVALTGFPPGGVCPFALPHPVRILIDVSLQRFPVVYVAAGSPHAVVGMTFPQLLEVTGGELCELA